MNADIQIPGTLPTTRTSTAERAAVFAALVLLSIAGHGCLGASAGTDEPRSSDARSRPQQIEELRQDIHRNHAMLEELIMRPRTDGVPPLHDDPEIRAIAARLSDQVRALEHLEAAQRPKNEGDSR